MEKLPLPVRLFLVPAVVWFAVRHVTADTTLIVILRITKFSIPIRNIPGRFYL